MRISQTHSFCLALGLAAAFTFTVHAEDLDLDLKYGRYNVGFKLFSEYDYRRTIRPRQDFEGKKYQGNNHRHMQIAFWYPTESKGESMSLGDYAALKQHKFVGGDLTNELKQAGRNSYREELRGDKLTDAQISTLFSLPVKAINEAEIAKGPFPLIVMAQGGYSEAFTNSYLCEYLASHGYVVVSFPTFGNSSEQIEIGLIGLEAQVGDMEFALAFARSLPQVDISRVAAIGKSWGGLSSVALALKNHNISAVVSLDGTIISQWAQEEFAKHYPYFHGRHLRAPFLNMYASRHAERDGGFAPKFFDETLYADTYQFAFAKLNHDHFDSEGVFIDLTLRGDSGNDEVAQGDATIDDVRNGFEQICRYTLLFLNAYLHQDRESLELLRNPEVDDVAPKGLITATHRAALPTPPSEREFIKVLTDRGNEEAWNVYKRTITADPEYRIFGKRGLARLGYRSINAKNYDLAKACFEFLTDAYNDYGNGWHGLGEAHMYLGHTEKAIQAFKKSIELIPENTIAKNFIEELKSGKK